MRLNERYGMLRQLSECDPQSEKGTGGTDECERHTDYELQQHPCRVLTFLLAT